MPRIEKTVFMSYRRTNAPWALAIFQNLNNNGYDVFFDFNGINSGDFESVILGNIKARAHFLVLLTPSALEKCNEPGDWLRREIEIALEYKRNIVPLMLEGFDFSTPAIANQLTGKLARLKNYNALGVPADYFMEAMERLRQRYLNVPLEAVLHPASQAVREITKSQQEAAETAPSVAEEELTAQQWFERGYEAKDLDEKIHFYSQAILRNPKFAEAFHNRGWALDAKGDLDGALADYDAAISLKPNNAHYLTSRGFTRRANGDLDGAIKDYSISLRIKPSALAFSNRGVARGNKGDLEGEIEDYANAILTDPSYYIAYYNRAQAFEDRANYKAAIADFQKYLDLGGGVRDGDQDKVEQMIRDLKKKLIEPK